MAASSVPVIQTCISSSVSISKPRGNLHPFVAPNKPFCSFKRSCKSAFVAPNKPFCSFKRSCKSVEVAMAAPSVPVKQIDQDQQRLSDDAFIRPHVKELAPYQPIHPFEVLSAQLGRKPENILQLEANENPYGPPPPEVLEEVGALKFPYIYPDPETVALDLGTESIYILVGCGGDELIDLITRCIREPGEKIVDCPPTFSMYAFGAAVDAPHVIKGLAGLRVGYGVFLRLIKYRWRAQQPYNVSCAAKVSALTALQNPIYLEKVKNALVEEQKRLFKLLEGVPLLVPYPSYANFILFEVTSGMDIKQLKDALAQMGVKIPYIYPDPESRHLRAALALDSVIESDYIHVGYSCDELMDLLMRCAPEPGEKTVKEKLTDALKTVDDVSKGKCEAKEECYTVNKAFRIKINPVPGLNFLNLEWSSENSVKGKRTVKTGDEAASEGWLGKAAKAMGMGWDN